MGNWHDIGQTHYGTVNGQPYVRIYTFPQFTQIAVGYRVGRTDRLDDRIGEVIRGVDYRGYFLDMRGDIGNSTDIYIAPGAMHQAVRVDVPRTAPGLPGNLRDPFDIRITPSPIPLGLFRPGCDDPNSNNWAGLGTEGIVVLDRVPPPSADIVVGTAKLYTSPKPQWTVTVPEALTVGQLDRIVRVRVAYSDGEAVPALRVSLAAETPDVELQFGGGWAVSGVAFTDSDGVIELPIRALTANGTALRVYVADARTSPEFFSPYFDEVLPVNTVATIVGGRSCVVIPPVAAIARVPAQELRSLDLGWNSSANSIDTVIGNAEMTLNDMGLCVGVVIGFTTNRVSLMPQRIEHGFYFHTNSRGRRVVDVYERGQTKGVQLLDYELEDVFKITRAEGSVSYFFNGTRIYTSTQPSTGELSLGEALYATGDSV